MSDKFDPYAGIDLPNPPRGYRLAKWGEECESGGMWFYVNIRNQEVGGGHWRNFPTIHSWRYSNASAWNCIFAVPKPRIRIELEQGDEVE